MPSSYTMETLPKPHNPAVKLKEIAAKRYAVIRFSGMAGEDDLKRRTKELNALVSAREPHATISPYSTPFITRPGPYLSLRRNEMMVEIPASPAD